MTVRREKRLQPGELPGLLFIMLAGARYRRRYRAILARRAAHPRAAPPASRHPWWVCGHCQAERQHAMARGFTKGDCL